MSDINKTNVVVSMELFIAAWSFGGSVASKSIELFRLRVIAWAGIYNY